jgi:hypothetical protein
MMRARLSFIGLACSLGLAGCGGQSSSPAHELSAASNTLFQAVPVSKCTAQTKDIVRNKIKKKAPIGNQMCWAASAEMAMNAIEANVPHEQCLQSNERFNQSGALGDCCGTLMPGDCDQPAGGIPPLRGWTSKELNRALDVGEITEELCVQQRPFLIARPATGGSGHMEIAVGYDEDDQGAIVLAYNPSGLGVVSAATITLKEYTTSYTQNFYVIGKKQ